MTSPYQAAAGVAGVDPTFDLNNEVNDAIETLVDGINGYSTVAENAEREDLKRMFNELAASRRSVAEQLVRTAADAGFEVRDDLDGTASGALHRAWIAVEGKVAGDSALISSAQNGESHAFDDITEALERPFSASVASALRDALSNIEAAQRRLEATADNV